MRHLFAIAAFVLVVPSVQAFASIQRGDSPHDDITAVAEEVGWPEDAVEALQAAVRQPDIDDLKTVKGEDGKSQIDASVTYAPWHHCTRQPPGGDAAALNATIAYIHEQRGIAENLSLLDPAAAVRALGRALHALQDCFSHSDVVDLDAATAGRLTQALVHGGDAPDLRLCGVLPHTDDMERPPGDPYSHADFNKDDPKASPEAKSELEDGRSKYEHAHELAANATAAFLTDFMARLDADETKRLLDVSREKTAREGLGIPGPGLLVVPLLAVAVALRRRDA